MLNFFLAKLSSHNKTLVQGIGRKLGLEIRLTGPSSREDLRLAQMLNAAGVDLVLDIGANRGQFALQLLSAGYSGKIVSFEPLPEVHAELVRRAEKYPGGRWKVAACVALSDHDGVAKFHVNLADTTSSLLGVSAEAVAVMPGVAGAQEINVKTTRLDSLLEKLDLRNNRFFIKIDVQGAEECVLAGAPHALQLAIGVVVELSLKELYIGQALSRDILASLQGYGFEVHDLVPGYRDLATFRLYQFDAVLFNPSRVANVKYE